MCGCNKDFESFVADPNVVFTDSAWANTPLPNMPINQMFTNLQLPFFTDSISNSSGGKINFPNNVSLNIQPNSFLSNGITADGKAVIKFQLLTKKGDMIRMSKPSQSNSYLMENYGQIFIDASKYGQPLTIAPSKQLQISFTATSPNSLIKAFIGYDPANLSGVNSTFNWLPANTNNVGISFSSNGYQVLTNTLYWISCGYFTDSSALKTSVGISMPLAFTNTNTAVFIVYKNTNGVMQFDADVLNKIWIKNRVPINKDVLFVSISKINNDYWLGTAMATTTINFNTALKPTIIKLPDLINYLSLL